MHVRYFRIIWVGLDIMPSRILVPFMRHVFLALVSVKISSNLNEMEPSHRWSLELTKVVFSIRGYLATTSLTAKRGGGAGWQCAQNNWADEAFSMPFRVNSVRKLDNSMFRPYLEKPEVQNNVVIDDSFYMAMRTCMGTVEGELQILDKVKWNSKPPSPPNQGWSRGKGKNAPFSHPWLFCPRL